jgi:hypothetical protein
MTEIIGNINKAIIQLTFRLFNQKKYFANN